MASFRDCEGSLWEIRVDIPAVKRVRSLAGVDLLNVAVNDRKASVYVALSDPVSFAEIVYALCKPEADKRGLGDEAFARLLDIDVEPLAEAILGEIADFFQRRGQVKMAEMVRWQVRKAKEGHQRMMAAIGEDTLTKLDQAFDLATTIQIEELKTKLSELQTTYGGSSTSLPESLESTATKTE